MYTQQCRKASWIELNNLCLIEVVFSFYQGLEHREFRSIIGKLPLPIVSFGIVAYVSRFRRITFSKARAVNYLHPFNQKSLH